MQKTHRQNQNSFGITSELAVGKPLLTSGPVSARPPGRAGDTAGPRARCSVAESDRMRPDRFQAWDTAGKPRPLPTSLHLPVPALDLPSPHAPSPTVPPFASPTLAPYSSRRDRRYRSGRDGVKTEVESTRRAGDSGNALGESTARGDGPGRAGGPGTPWERCCGSAGRWGSGSGRRGWARGWGSSYLRGEAPGPGGGGGSGCGTPAPRRLLHHNIPRPGARGPRGCARSGGARGAGARGEGRHLSRRGRKLLGVARAAASWRVPPSATLRPR